MNPKSVQLWVPFILMSDSRHWNQGQRRVSQWFFLGSQSLSDRTCTCEIFTANDSPCLETLSLRKFCHIYLAQDLPLFNPEARLYGPALPRPQWAQRPFPTSWICAGNFWAPVIVILLYVTISDVRHVLFKDSELNAVRVVTQCNIKSWRHFIVYMKIMGGINSLVFDLPSWLNCVLKQQYMTENKFQTHVLDTTQTYNKSWIWLINICIRYETPNQDMCEVQNHIVYVHV